MRHLLTMCPEDQERFGGPETVEYDHGKVEDLDIATLTAFEDATGMTLGEFGEALTRDSVAGRRAVLWLARKLAGCDDAWDSFTPKVLKVQISSPEGVEPPEGKDVPAANRAERRAAERNRSATR